MEKLDKISHVFYETSYTYHILYYKYKRLYRHITKRDFRIFLRISADAISLRICSASRQAKLDCQSTLDLKCSKFISTATSMTHIRIHTNTYKVGIYSYKAADLQLEDDAESVDVVYLKYEKQKRMKNKMRISLTKERSNRKVPPN